MMKSISAILVVAAVLAGCSLTAEGQQETKRPEHIVAYDVGNKVMCYRYFTHSQISCVYTGPVVYIESKE